MDSLEKRFQNIEINKTRLIPPKEETEKQKSKSKFKNFAMINKEYQEKFVNLIKEYPNSLNIFVYLIFNRNKYDNSVSISLNDIQEKLNLSKNTILKAIKILANNDFIQKIRTKTTNYYIINDFIVSPINKNKCEYHELSSFNKYFNFFKINYTLLNKNTIFNIINNIKYSISVFLFLLLEMDKQNKVEITKKEIKQILNISKYEVFENAIKTLEEYSFIISTRDFVNHLYIFEINPQIADNKN